MRHGQSQGNVDDKVYATVPDSQIALTERGFAQAVVAGLQIRSLVGNGTVRVFYSPYLRTKQTMLAILQALGLGLGLGLDAILQALGLGLG